MQQYAIIGNLGSDAEVKNENGRSFVSLSIANTQRRTDAQGNVKETTDWVSATINGDGGNLLPYLKKGAKVYAIGDMSLRQYHSEKDHCLKAGVNLYIRSIELISTNVDAVPRELYDKNGLCYKVAKYYMVGDQSVTELYDRRGQAYTVKDGWVAPIQAQQATTDATDQKEQSTDEIY